MKSFDNHIVSIEMLREENLTVFPTSEIEGVGYSEYPKDGKELGLVESNYIVPAREQWGLKVRTPHIELPLDEGDQLILRILAADDEDDYVDAEIVQCEFSEFEGDLCRLHKESFQVYTFLP